MAHVVLSGGGCCCDPPDWPHVVLAPACGACAVPPPPEPDPVGLTGELRQRTRTGFDDDGVPEFVWATVSDGPVTLVEVRDEFDGEAGLTSVTGVVTGSATGLVTETSMVYLSDGTRWRVWGVDQSGATVRLQVVRIDQAATGEVNS
jgi:hypothetical protein